MSGLYQLQPLHDGCNQKKDGQELGNLDRLSLIGKEIKNVYTADATPSQLAPTTSGVDADGKGVL